MTDAELDELERLSSYSAIRRLLAEVRRLRAGRAAVLEEAAKIVWQEVRVSGGTTILADSLAAAIRAAKVEK